MSRSIIAGAVAVIIAALTATAYFVTTSSQTEKVERDLKARVERARSQLQNAAVVEARRAEGKIVGLAAQPGLLAGLRALVPPPNPPPGFKPESFKPDWKELKRQVDLTFSEFLAEEKDKKPDVLALVDATGDVVFMNGVSLPTASEFKDDKGQVKLPALAEALKRRIVIIEVTQMPAVGLARLVVAPVIDHERSTEEKTVIAGVVVAAYAITAKAAQAEDSLLGVRVAYFDSSHVSATSFRRGKDEDTEIREKINAVLDRAKLRARALDEKHPEGAKVAAVEVDGKKYLAAAVPLSRQHTKPLPAEYPAQDAGALVLISVGDEAAAFTRSAKIFILLLGIGSMVVALFGLYLLYMRFEHQIDELEVGVAEIINGNLDRTFQPVGAELDGLANGLNVMLARLLGRPEPGEEAFDENGNPIIPGKVDFEEAPEAGQGAAPPAPDPELAALAQEPEPDYYKRLFTEYVAARKQTGSPDDVSFESFIAKLRVNEGKLKAQYQCKAVRFRVVVKDGRVSLKPVPIF
jgi:hypothetical protein